MFKKKIGIYALTFAMASIGITGCSSADPSSSSDSLSSSITEEADQSDNKASSASFSVVCTIFPEYDWVKEIIGDHSYNMELTYLLDNGIDLHSYQPTADDMMKISTCDLFVYVGGESDEWVEDALADAQNKDMSIPRSLSVQRDMYGLSEMMTMLCGTVIL
ncbi:MAG TPA: metal ABC transporter substrate-binding protein [Ruminococcus sp.]|nr:metal ABC transporter substrate-binding protein [Ruminococcus sp.]